MMMRPVIISLVCLSLVTVVGCVGKGKLAAGKEPRLLTQEEQKVKPAGSPAVIIETSKGTIKAELWPDKSPGTVSNFLTYADEKYYDGLIFHRVIDGFMIQGGGFAPNMSQKNATHPPIKNEASAAAPNKRGTLSMARTMQVDSATAQFFINLVDNGFLDHKNESAQGFGYCVFGKVTEGLSVVDDIGKSRTGNKAGFDDVPVDTVTIKSIRRAE
jgi:cyclophilin family peptidyl-prolyl cis-trans isomerase